MTQTNQQIAEELLRVISNSQHHNTALALKETLEKLRELMTGSALNWEEEQGMMYEFGWTDCLKQIDDICDELENL
jgi:hypothetical protein